MKKFLIIVMALVIVFAFAALLRYGFRHSRGVPVPITVQDKRMPTFQVIFLDREFDMSRESIATFWNKLPATEIKLIHQVTALPWPKALVPQVQVKAFHNNKDIYFYLEWEDSTEDRRLGTGQFSDACAIMFPLGKEVAKSMIMMGFMGRANIWQWKASQDQEYWNGRPNPPTVYADFHYPFEQQETFPVLMNKPASAASDLMSVRIGTVTTTEIQQVSGRGIYNEGVWRVVLKRSLSAPDTSSYASFKQPKRWCAFAVWNGARGDRGGRKSISDWVELEVLNGAISEFH